MPSRFVSSGEPDITLAVVAYRDPESLSRILESWAGAGPSFVVNVEADHEVRDAGERLGARVIDVAENCGFARAVNVAAARATTRHVLFANDDVTFGGSLSAGLRSALATGWPVVVPRHVDADGRSQPHLRRLPTPFGFLVEWVLLPDRPPRPRSGSSVCKWQDPAVAQRVEAATAAAVLVEVEVLRRIPLPEQYFLYWEEIDWFWQLSDHGIAVGTVPEFVIVRAGGRRELGPGKWWLLGRNVVWLGARRYGLAGRLGYFLLGALWIARLAALDSLAPDRQKRLRARRSAASGLLAGLRGPA